LPPHLGPARRKACWVRSRTKTSARRGRPVRLVRHREVTADSLAHLVHRGVVLIWSYSSEGIGSDPPRPPVGQHSVDAVSGLRSLPAAENLDSLQGVTDRAEPEARRLLIALAQFIHDVYRPVVRPDEEVDVRLTAMFVCLPCVSLAYRWRSVSTWCARSAAALRFAMSCPSRTPATASTADASGTQNRSLPRAPS
jgi:hypothetical protein